MKNIYILVLASLFFASCGPTTVVQSGSYETAPAPVEDVSYQSFYDELSPYGNWINYPGYGYVWSPNAGPDFQPYATNGNWIYTDAGWTWASNYNWGWAPFHYGRWFNENGYGWMWVPGNEWAPAWVSWRGGGDYYGWAPMGPNVSVNMALTNYNPPSNYWNFVPRQYMGNPNWHNYYVNPRQNVTIINNTTIINNYSGTNRSRYAFAPGPDPNEVRRYSGNNFSQVQLRQSSTPGARVSGSQYQIYQPRVSATAPVRGNDAGRPAVPAPRRYESFNNMRPANPNTGSQPNSNQQLNPRPVNPNQGNQNPVNNQPVNPRPSVQQPVNNQPYNNQPVSPRPGMQNPSNNPVTPGPQPAAARPSAQPPVNNQPVTNPQPSNARPEMRSPNNNQPAPANPRSGGQASTSQPVNHPQPARPSPSFRSQTTTPAQPASQAPASNSRPPQRNAETQPGAQRPPQRVATPAPVQNRPVQRAPAPENKTDPKPSDPPKTRSAN